MLVLLNENGYLSPGFHTMSITEFEETFVNTFPTSTTRPNIFNGYSGCCSTLQTLGITDFHQWINGSFCTSKINPNDIDVVTFIDYAVLNSLSHEQQVALNSFADRVITKNLFACDSFVLCVPPQGDPLEAEYINNKMYWRGVWGFDRQDIPKGTVKIIFGGGARNE